MIQYIDPIINGTNILLQVIQSVIMQFAQLYIIEFFMVIVLYFEEQDNICHIMSKFRQYNKTNERGTSPVLESIVCFSQFIYY